MDTAQNIFAKFGGIRPMARALAEPASTVANWKRAGRIPAEKQQRVLEVGIHLGHAVTAEDLVYPNGKAPLRQPTPEHNVPNCPCATDGKAEQLTAPWDEQP